MRDKILFDLKKKKIRKILNMKPIPKSEERLSINVDNYLNVKLISIHWNGSLRAQVKYI